MINSSTKGKDPEEYAEKSTSQEGVDSQRRMQARSLRSSVVVQPYDWPATSTETRFTSASSGRSTSGRMRRRPINPGPPVVGRRASALKLGESAQGASLSLTPVAGCGGEARFPPIYYAIIRVRRLSSITGTDLPDDVVLVRRSTTRWSCATSSAHDCVVFESSTMATARLSSDARIAVQGAMLHGYFWDN